MVEILPDLTAGPSAAVSTRATGFNDAVFLCWQMPSDGAAGVRVVRKTGRFYPRDEDDGVVVYDGAADFCVDSAPPAGVNSCYAVFAYDARGNFAHGDVDSARSSATPTPPADIRLTVAGTPRVGNPFDLILDAPGDPGKVYFIACSLAERPALPAGNGRFLGLRYDEVFAASLDPGSKVFRNTVGTLLPQGSARATITFPVDLPLPVSRFYFAAFLLDPGAPIGVGKISKTILVDVQR